MSLLPRALLGQRANENTYRKQKESQLPLGSKCENKEQKRWIWKLKNQMLQKLRRNENNGATEQQTRWDTTKGKQVSKLVEQKAKLRRELQ